MNKVKLMNQYVANAQVLITKLHNLHWNVVGITFVPIHEYTEGLYDRFFEQYDEVAELLKMRDEYPIATVKGGLEIATIEELDDKKDFRDKEVLSIVKEDLELMKKLALEIREAADEEDDFGIVATFEDYIGEFDKDLWFLKAKLA